jgi:arylsulfatase A-like enzyme
MAYGKLSDHDHRVVRAAYWAMCDLIDEQVGRMLDALEATGQRDNTLIIFTSDHGEMLGDHGIYLKGPYFYEGAVHVPLIISAPRSTGAAVPAIGDLVELTDLAQTILDAAGLPHHPGMQGKSLWPLLTGGAVPAEPAAPSGLGASQRDRPHREDVYCEYYNAMPWHRDPTPQLTMVRTERYKLTLDHGAAFGELYDLELDPTETLNRWNDPEHASVKMDMLIRLADRMAFTADPLPLRRAAW